MRTMSVQGVRARKGLPAATTRMLHGLVRMQTLMTIAIVLSSEAFSTSSPFADEWTFLRMRAKMTYKEIRGVTCYSEATDVKQGAHL